MSDLNAFFCVGCMKAWLVFRVGCRISMEVSTIIEQITVSVTSSKILYIPCDGSSAVHKTRSASVFGCCVFEDTFSAGQ